MTSEAHVRMRSMVAGSAAAALLLAACGDDAPDDDAAAQERIAELEDELEEVRQDAEELLEENERLHEEIRLLTEDDPDEAEPEEEPDEADPADEEPVDDEADDQPAAGPEPERSPEGLSEQLRTLFELPTGPDGEWEPGTTEWSSTEPPEGLEDSYGSPGELAFDLAATLDAQMLGMDSWETTTRVLLDDDDPDVAYVAVLSWGFADDSIAGRDLRMTITHDDGAWSPGGAEERYHCRRGVTDEDLCL